MDCHYCGKECNEIPAEEIRKAIGRYYFAIGVCPYCKRVSEPSISSGGRIDEYIKEIQPLMRKYLRMGRLTSKW
jgi:hypothetical protein